MARPFLFDPYPNVRARTTARNTRTEIHGGMKGYHDGKPKETARPYSPDSRNLRRFAPAQRGLFPAPGAPPLSRPGKQPPCARGGAAGQPSHSSPDPGGRGGDAPGSRRSPYARDSGENPESLYASRRNEEHSRAGTRPGESLHEHALRSVGKQI